MFEGVYCAEKNPNTVHETILIDSFDNCIKSALDPQSAAENLPDSSEMTTANDEMSSSEACSNNPVEPLVSCYFGQDVRATYSVDKKRYEAVVKGIFGKPPYIKARVRYHGYGNEETVPMNMIFPSLGPKAIKDQIEQARLEMGDHSSSDESVKKEIKWMKGMACRALYEEKDIIYEATVLDVNDEEKTAYVEMLGYGSCYHAKFDKMYESIPELRKKQAISAEKHMEQQKRILSTSNCGGDQPSGDLRKEIKSDLSKESKLETISEEGQSCESSISNGVHPKDDTNYSDLETKVDVTSAVSKEPKLVCTIEKECNSESLASGGALPKENGLDCPDSALKVNVLADTSKEAQSSINDMARSSETLASDGAQSNVNRTNGIDLNNSLSESPSLIGENHLPLSLISEEILKPETEPQALACLLSANYLSGYYAGYYDCIRRRQNSDKV